MLRLFFFVYLISNVHSECYLKSSQSWLCDGRQIHRNRSSLDYLSVLNNRQPEKMTLIHYNLSILNLDNYPRSLRTFNASGNRIRTISISSKHRQSSNLRHLILQSNGIERFDIENIILPHSLQTISLANNRLKIIDARLFSHLESLVTLDLSHNQLKRILPQLLFSIDVQLNNNPLECQCTPEPYRSVCEKATSLKRNTIENNNCMAPYYNPRPFEAQPPPYLRFSTFILVCPIHGYPLPIIIWSTPFGNLTAVNSSNVDMLSSVDDEPLYVTLTALAGPLTARTKHTLHAFDSNHLSVTEARAALEHRISCTATNMLGTLTYEFNFDIHTFVRDRALWQLVYTAGFGLFMALVAGALCVTLKRTSYYQGDHLKTPPIYPTMTPNSASRTPPNFEWLSVAAANISGTLEQVRDKLRLGVQQVSEHMGQTVGRATELFTHGVQHAGGTIRQAAETSAAYLQSFRETSQHRLNTMRVQTLSSLRNPGHLMRAGMNMLTTQVNSLRDYCGVTTGHPLAANYFTEQQQHMQYTPLSLSQRQHNRITTIMEDDETIVESISLMGALHRSPYAGHTATTIIANTSGIGRLDTADSSALAALNNFTRSTDNLEEDDEITARGQMSAGIGTFHDHDNDDLIDEPERLTIYGEQRPVC